MTDRLLLFLTLGGFSRCRQTHKLIVEFHLPGLGDAILLKQFRTAPKSCHSTFAVFKRRQFGGDRPNRATHTCSPYSGTTDTMAQSYNCA